MLYSGENMETPTGVTKQDLCMKQAYWGFQHESWHNSCLQKCIISGRICAAVISVTQEIAAKICSQTTNTAYDESQCKANNENQVVRMAEFCIYLLDKVLLENDFSWDDILVSFLFHCTHFSVLMLSPLPPCLFNCCAYSLLYSFAYLPPLIIP